MKFENSITKCDEIRKKIIEVCSINGGHLGASLGAIELTVALHSVFDTPKDAIVWDVGHQSYAHKILTGRLDLIESLRKSYGASGFTSREESRHDVFGAGHSSTSISAALGIAQAKTLLNDQSWTVAVIGDGGLTSGLAFEALNQAGIAAHANLLIIVNDNNLSISENVGALDRFAFGTERAPRKFFESLGFEYLGPFDGHDVKKLETCFTEIKKNNLKKTPILHVITKKGKGFLPAEVDPIRFHGVGPFNITTGSFDASKSIGQETYSKILGETLIELAESDPQIVVITAAMAEGTGLATFQKKFPNRFFDVGIAEAHALVFAAGLATQGLKPVVAIYSTFLQRAVDSAIHDIALQNLNVVLCVDRAGFVGPDGPTHHGLYDLSMMKAIPNTSIAQPINKNDLIELLTIYLSSEARAGLKILRYPRGQVQNISKNQNTNRFGKLKVIQSADETILPERRIVISAFGSGVGWAFEAVQSLHENEQKRISIIDFTFAKPLDVDGLAEQLRRACAWMNIEDSAKIGGIGHDALAQLKERKLFVPEKIRLLGVEDHFYKHGEVQEQRNWSNLSRETIVKCLLEWMSV